MEGGGDGAEEHDGDAAEDADRDHLAVEEPLAEDDSMVTFLKTVTMGTFRVCRHMYPDVIMPTKDSDRGSTRSMRS